MKAMDKNLQSALTQLAVTEPVEPRGIFRWLHNHYLWRYGRMHTEFLFTGHDSCIWQQLADRPVPVYKRSDDDDLLLDVVNCHAWSFGLMGLKETTLALWDKLEPDSRAAFLAASSERGDADTCLNMLVTFSGSLAYSPESFCQLACNTIRAGRFDILEHLLAQPVDLEAAIRRFPAYQSLDGWENEQIARLSHRVIDIIFEASLIRNRPDMARLALDHGADPAIPVWQLERSYNHCFSALGYVIDSEFMQDMRPRREMAELLLEYGAPAAGVPFSGPGYELFLAVRKEWYDFAERLIALGAPANRPEYAPLSVKTTAGSGSVIVSPSRFYWFLLPEEELKWARDIVGGLIPLIPVTDKQVFFRSHCQGGEDSTLLSILIGKHNLLKRFVYLGLDTRLSAEELCLAVRSNAYEGLCFLLEQYGDSTRSQVVAAIRERKPDFGHRIQKDSNDAEVPSS